MSDDDLSVLVAIPTFRRPDTLAVALDGALRQEGVGIPFTVLVVDNDPGQSARPVVQSFGRADVRYLPEPRPGLASVRNAVLDNAHDARLLAFLDDDEVPGPGWLAALTTMWRDEGCDAVAGPQDLVLPRVVSGWVTASGFFDRVPRTTGVRVTGASSGNLLLDLVTVRRLGLRFDERFGFTGGEDSMFTHTLTAHGGVIKWCEEAALSEPVPEDRATRPWVLRRELRMGSAWSRVHTALARSVPERLRVGARLVGLAALLLVRGAAFIVSGFLTHTLRRRARGEREVARSIGVLRGLAGARVEEYARTA